MTELESAVDYAVLDELCKSVGDDPVFVAELESLRGAATSGDATGARRAAHTLKGNGRTFGAGGLASLCQEAETAAAAGDLDAVLSRLDEIEGEWRRVCAELLVWRNDRA